jgi:hypothetical protein
MARHDDPSETPRRRLRMPLADKSPRTRSVVLATGLLVLGISPFAIAKTGSNLREGLRNGTATRETQIISNVGSTTTTTGGYSTRQSNLSASGGGAVYGCRSRAGGSAATPTPQNPCVRSNNLSSGLAFEFNSSNGDTVGLITAGTGGDTKKPFTTNATGVATGLNADRVDGKDAADISKDGATAAVAATQAANPFAQVTAGGTLGTTRGLIATSPISHTTNSGIYNVTFTGDLSKCALTATLTGTAPGEITATPAVAGGNTTVDVRTFNDAAPAAATDRAFNLTATC